MARLMVLLVCISTCLLEDGCSLRWEEELKPQFINCSGEDVAFPWRYSLDVGDTLVGISWSHRPTAADKDTTFGTYGLGSFSAPDKRISQVEEAGIKLSNLSSNDSGTYIVNVRLSGRGGVHTQNTTLLVAEPPTTKTGRLEVLINDLPVSMTTQTKTATVKKNGKDRLMCGHFTHLGTPPTSVVWKDPDNRILPSTSYEMGYFILELSEQSKGGNYHCMLNDSSKAVDCLPPDTQLRDTVEVKVAKSSSPSVGASMSGGIIAAIVIVVVILIAVIVVILVFVILRRRKGKSYAPKEPDSPGPEGPEDEARQPFKV